MSKTEGGITDSIPPSVLLNNCFLIIFRLDGVLFY